MPEDIAALGAALRAGHLDPVELVEATLKELRSWEPFLHATTEILDQRALAVAEQRLAELRDGLDRGPLHGIPIAVKDLLDQQGVRNTAGSRILADNVATSDAAIVRALEEAGAVVVARSNTHEFAFGALTPPTRNPWDTQCMPGGSSGGSAALVAAGIVRAAIGSDTGGSIREPAALCGVVGCKPTTGAFDLDGVIPLSWSLDSVGPLAATPADAAVVLEAMGAARRTPPPGAGLSGPRGARIALWAELHDRMQAEVREAYVSTLAALDSAGAILEEVSLGEPDEAVGVALVLLGAEALSYHRRWYQQRPKDYAPDVLAYLDLSATFTAADLVDAQRLRNVWRERVARCLGAYDLLLTPAQLVVAPRVEADRVELEDGRTAPRDLTLIRPLAAFNVTGHPAVSVPVGSGARTGLPVSIQLVGPAGSEAGLLAVAAGCQAEVRAILPASPPRPVA